MRTFGDEENLRVRGVGGALASTSPTPGMGANSEWSPAKHPVLATTMRTFGDEENLRVRGVGRVGGLSESMLLDDYGGLLAPVPSIHPPRPSLQQLAAEGRVSEWYLLDRMVNSIDALSAEGGHAPLALPPGDFEAGSLGFRSRRVPDGAHGPWRPLPASTLQRDGGAFKSRSIGGQKRSVHAALTLEPRVALRVAPDGAGGVRAALAPGTPWVRLDLSVTAQSHALDHPVLMATMRYPGPPIVLRAPEPAVVRVRLAPRPLQPMVRLHLSARSLSLDTSARGGPTEVAARLRITSDAHGFGVGVGLQVETPLPPPIVQRPWPTVLVDPPSDEATVAGDEAALAASPPEPEGVFERFAARCGLNISATAAADRLRLLETILYDLLLVNLLGEAAKLGLELWRPQRLRADPASRGLAEAGGVVGLMLLVHLAFALLSFHGNVASFLRALPRRGWHMHAATASGHASAGRPAGTSWVRRPQPGHVTSERMGHRVLYITARFAEHSPRWQLFIWWRQWLLALCAFAPRVHRVYVGAAGDRFEPTSVLALAAHCAGAVVVLLIGYTVHMGRLPWANDFANQLDGRLYLAAIGVLCGGALSTAAARLKGDPATAELASLLGTFAEVQLVLVVLFSFGGALYHFLDQIGLVGRIARAVERLRDRQRNRLWRWALHRVARRRMTWWADGEEPSNDEGEGSDSDVEAGDGPRRRGETLARRRQIKYRKEHESDDDSESDSSQPDSARPKGDKKAIGARKSMAGTALGGRLRLGLGDEALNPGAKGRLKSIFHVAHGEIKFLKEALASPRHHNPDTRRHPTNRGGNHGRHHTNRHGGPLTRTTRTHRIGHHPTADDVAGQARRSLIQRQMNMHEDPRHAAALERKRAYMIKRGLDPDEVLPPRPALPQPGALPRPTKDVVKTLQRAAAKTQISAAKLPPPRMRERQETAAKPDENQRGYSVALPPALGRRASSAAMRQRAATPGNDEFFFLPPTKLPAPGSSPVPLRAERHSAPARGPPAAAPSAAAPSAAAPSAAAPFAAVPSAAVPSAAAPSASPRAPASLDASPAANRRQSSTVGGDGAPVASRGPAAAPAPVSLPAGPPALAMLAASPVALDAEGAPAVPRGGARANDDTRAEGIDPPLEC